MQLLKKRSPYKPRATETPPPAVAVLSQPEPEDSASSDVQVVYGASVQNLPLAGLTVAQARDAAALILRVDGRAPALINGRPARPDEVISPGDMIEFVHHAGEKG